MPTENDGEDILAKWAEVEHTLTHAKRQFETLARGTDEAASLRAEIDRLIDEWANLWNRYQQLVDEAKEHLQPSPPEWPEPAS